MTLAITPIGLLRLTRYRFGNSNDECFRSFDHLEYVDEAGIKAMSSADVVAVLLPGAYYCLQETKRPPIQRLPDYKVGMAIATDCNPATSPTTSMKLMMNMACQLFGLSVPEVLSGVTWQAARDLGIEKEVGDICAHKIADIVCWDVQDSAQLCYYVGYVPPHRTMVAGLWQSK